MPTEPLLGTAITQPLSTTILTKFREFVSYGWCRYSLYSSRFCGLVSVGRSRQRMSIPEIGLESRGIGKPGIFIFLHRIRHLLLQ